MKIQWPADTTMIEEKVSEGMGDAAELNAGLPWALIVMVYQGYAEGSNVTELSLPQLMAGLEDLIEQGRETGYEGA